MKTPEEHYKEAERILAQSEGAVSSVAQYRVMVAQVHATLALATAETYQRAADL